MPCVWPEGLHRRTCLASLSSEDCHSVEASTIRLQICILPHSTKGNSISQQYLYPLYFPFQKLRMTSSPSRKRTRHQKEEFRKLEESTKTLTNFRLPNEIACNFFELAKKLGHKSDGDTIAWLMNKAETSVQAIITDTEQEQDNKNTERKGQICGKYEVNQVWALWDDGVDGMPRVYVQIKKLLLEELKVEVAFLERTDEVKKWVTGCGRFKVKKSTSIAEISEFSHQVNLDSEESSEMSRVWVDNGETWANIFPRDGEIWAVYKDWNENWTLHDFSHARYELVELVSEFVLTVIYLIRVGDSGAVFERGYHRGEVKWREYNLKQRSQFSHRIPAAKLKVEEMKGIPNEAWKLNPEAVPLHLL